MVFKTSLPKKADGDVLKNRHVIIIDITLSNFNVRITHDL
jgi:hypothetical protein